MNVPKDIFDSKLVNLKTSNKLLFLPPEINQFRHYQTLLKRALQYSIGCLVISFSILEPLYAINSCPSEKIGIYAGNTSLFSNCWVTSNDKVTFPTMMVDNSNSSIKIINSIARDLEPIPQNWRNAGIMFFSFISDRGTDYYGDCSDSQPTYTDTTVLRTDHIYCGIFSGLNYNIFIKSQWDGATFSNYSIKYADNKPPYFNSSIVTESVNEGSNNNSIQQLIGVTDRDLWDVLTWSILTSPSKGTLSGFDAIEFSNGNTIVQPNNVSYTPNSGYNGTDSFVIQVSDGKDTDEITVNLTIKSQNDSPIIAINQGITINEGKTAIIDNSKLNEGDPDDDGTGLTYTIIAIPNYGFLKKAELILEPNATFSQADIDANSISYEHDGSDTSSFDSFNFSLADGGENDATPVMGTFNISINFQNDSPVIATNNAAIVNEGDKVIITTNELNEGDPDDAGADLTYTITFTPSHGILKNRTIELKIGDSFTQADIDDNKITYQHDGSETITDSINLSLADGRENGAIPIIVTFNINVNSAPVVSSINLGSSAVVNDNSVAFDISFSEAVRNVYISDFVLATEEGVLGNINSITKLDDMNYTVTVNNVFGNGKLGLNLVDNDSIINQSRIPLGGFGTSNYSNGSFIGATYTIDTVASNVVIEKAIELIEPTEPTDDNIINFTAVFDEIITDFTNEDITITGTAGATSATVNQIVDISAQDTTIPIDTTEIPSNDPIYNIEVSNMLGHGTVIANIAANTVTDEAGNGNNASNSSNVQYYANSDVVINEVDYNQGVIDNSEFIELYNKSTNKIDLALYEIRLIDANGTRINKSINNLTGILEPENYYVICGNNSNVANCDLVITPDSDFIQDDIEAIILVQITNNAVVDALTYGGTLSSHRDIYTETINATKDPIAIGDEQKGLSRINDGEDSNNNSNDFAVRCATPGISNTVKSSDCMPEIVFSQSTYSVTEDVAISEIINLTRTGFIDSTSSVQVQITGGTASGDGDDGIDYINLAFPKTIDFAVGETTQTLVISIVDDRKFEPGDNETIIFTLEAPIGAIIGSQNTAILEIIDNEDNDGNIDSDNDGLNDDIEIILNLDPNNSDSDDNGIIDGDEDTDSDGLSNSDEINITQTNPLVVDSDDNGISDYDEDFDNDGVSDGDEIMMGLDPNNGNENIDTTISNAYLTNISTRANISGGANDAFTGFIISGSGTQQVIIRGIAVAENVDPAITLLKRNGSNWDFIAENDEWEDASNADMFSGLKANLQLPDRNGNDAGLLIDLEPGIYSAQLSSVTNSGLALIGVDVTHTESDNPKLINISTRAYISGGVNDIFAGFAISGNNSQQMMIRGIAVDDTVDPALTLFKLNGGSWEVILTNDEWEDDSNAIAVTTLASNLQLPDRNNNDAGILMDLEPGVYSVQLSSNDSAGVALIGVDTIE